VDDRSSYVRNPALDYLLDLWADQSHAGAVRLVVLCSFRNVDHRALFLFGAWNIHKRRELDPLNYEQFPTFTIHIANK